MVGPPFRLKGSRCVLEELLLPAVEDRGLESVLATQFRDRNLLQQMPPQDGNFFFRRIVLPLLLHAFAPIILNGGTLSPFPAEREHSELRKFRAVGTESSPMFTGFWQILD